MSRPAGEQPIRLLLLCRHRLLLEAIRGGFAARPDFELCAALKDPAEVRRRLAHQSVDVLLVDASVDPEPALDLTREVASRWPEVKVLPFGLDGRRAVLGFLEAGASGYCQRQDSFDALLHTAAAVHQRRPPCSPEVLAAVLQRITELARGQEPPADLPLALSRRELDVLQMMAGGLRNKEIASRLRLAVPTVKNHVHNVLAKLRTGTRRDAIRRAYEIGILVGPSPWNATLSRG